MHEEDKNNEPGVRQEGAKMSLNTPQADAEVSDAADQLASMTVVGSGSDTSDGDETEVKEEVKGGDPELMKPHLPMEDCPVCLVPLPILGSDRTYWPCCGKGICNACVEEHGRALRVTNAKRKKKEKPPLERTCAFCRTPVTNDDAGYVKRCKERANEGDKWAAFNLACDYRDGGEGVPKDEAKAVELYQRAADLGHHGAIAALGAIYSFGEHGVVQNEKKGREYLKNATKKGSVLARNGLALLEESRGNIDLAIRHYRLAAAAGYKRSMKRLWTCFYEKTLSKVDLEATLRAYKAACDEMNSEDRERLAACKEAKAGDDEILENLYAAYYSGELNAKELKKALKCKRGENWNMEELGQTLKAVQARRRASGEI